MKNILSISDSIKNTRFDVRSSTATIKFYGMEPYVIVPEFVNENGESSKTDITESLEFCFSECEPDCIAVGFTRDHNAIDIVSRLLSSREHAGVLAAPSLISDAGEIMVGEETYYSVIGSLLPQAQFLLVNSYEAELLSEIECHTEKDFLRACKKIYNVYNCLTLIRGGERTGYRDLIFVGNDHKWLDPVEPVPGFDTNLASLFDAIACELVSDKSILEAVISAREYAVGRLQAQRIDFPNSQAKPEVKEEAKPEVKEEIKEEVKPEVKVETPMINVSPALISPAKNLRDIARKIETDSNPMPKIVIPGVTTPEPAKTSLIEAPEPGPRGTVSEIKAKEYKSIDESLGELQKMKDRLKKLSEM